MSSPRPHKRARATAARSAVDGALEDDVALLDAHTSDAFSLELPPALDDDSLDLMRLEAPFSVAFIQKLFRMPAPARKKTTHADTRQPVTVVPRFYEEKFLWQRHSTRLCCFHDKCEGMRLTNCEDGCEPFTLPEYRLPGKRNTAEPQPCLLCLRKLMSIDFYNVTVAAHDAAQDSAPESAPACAPCEYANLVDVPGEYRLADTLLSPQNAMPVVKHLRSAYVICRQGGVLRVKQLYGDPADEDATDAYFCRGARHKRTQTCE